MAHPVLYKSYMKPRLMLYLIIALIVIGMATAGLFAAIGVIKFKYFGLRSYYVGCTILHTKDFKDLFMITTVSVVYFCDIVLLISYIVMHKKLYKPGLRLCMNKFKQTARRIALIVTTTYVVCYMPLVISYTVHLYLDDKVYSDRQTLFHDYVMRMFSHAHSTILPFIIVKSKSLKHSDLAAKASVRYTTQKIHVANACHIVHDQLVITNPGSDKELRVKDTIERSNEHSRSTREATSLILETNFVN